MILYVPLFCLFCVFMVYNDYVNRRYDPTVSIVFITDKELLSMKHEEHHGEKKQLAKKNSKDKKAVSQRGNESKNF